MRVFYVGLGGVVKDGMDTHLEEITTLGRGLLRIRPGREVPVEGGVQDYRKVWKVCGCE